MLQIALFFYVLKRTKKNIELKLLLIIYYCSLFFISFKHVNIFYLNTDSLCDTHLFLFIFYITIFFTVFILNHYMYVCIYIDTLFLIFNSDGFHLNLTRTKSELLSMLIVMCVEGSCSLIQKPFIRWMKIMRYSILCYLRLHRLQ